MKKRIYLCDIEYLYMENSPDYNKFIGGAVYVFVKGFDVIETLDKLLIELKNLGLKPKIIESIIPFDPDMEWETIEQTKHFNGLYNKSLNSDDVVFDEFYAYEKE